MKTPNYSRIVLPGLFVGLGALVCWQFYPGATPMRDSVNDGQSLESADAQGVLKQVSQAGSEMPNVAGQQAEAEARPLNRATVQEAAEEASGDLLKRLDGALARHPNVKMITQENVYDFSKGDGGNVDSNLEEALRHFLEWAGQSRAQVETIKNKSKAWAQEVFGRSVKDGYVLYDFDKIRDGLLLRNLEKIQERNALRDFRAPAGINLPRLIKQWWTVREDVSLDSEVLYPVAFSKEPSLNDLRKAFSLRGASLASTKWKAVDDFAAAYEGPEGDENFKPIAKALKSSGIRQRFYFSGGGEGRGGQWSTNILLVVDEHNQAWGFQMGYSE